MNENRRCFWLFIMSMNFLAAELTINAFIAILTGVLFAYFNLDAVRHLIPTKTYRFEIFYKLKLLNQLM